MKTKNLCGQGLVDLFDSSLEFVEKLGNKYQCVYRVSDGSKDFIFKYGVGTEQGRSSNILQVNNEVEALSRAKRLSGVPKLFERYESIDDVYFALLKEYILGRTLKECGEMLSERELLYLRYKTRDIDSELRRLGIFNLDVKSENVVINNSGIPFFIDLGCVGFDEQPRGINGPNLNLFFRELLRQFK